MTKYIKLLLALVYVIALDVGSAQGQATSAQARAEVKDMSGVIERVDAVVREIVIDSHRLTMPPGVAVRYPFGLVRYGLDGLAPGMHVRFDGKLPLSPRDAGEIRGLTVIAN